MWNKHSLLLRKNGKNQENALTDSALAWVAALLSAQNNFCCKETGNHTTDQTTIELTIL